MTDRSVVHRRSRRYRRSPVRVAVAVARLREHGCESADQAPSERSPQPRKLLFFSRKGRRNFLRIFQESSIRRTCQTGKRRTCQTSFPARETKAPVSTRVDPRRPTSHFLARRDGCFWRGAGSQTAALGVVFCEMWEMCRELTVTHENSEREEEEEKHHLIDKSWTTIQAFFVWQVRRM